MINDTERYSASLRINSEYGKIRTRKTPNTDTFHAVATVMHPVSNYMFKINNRNTRSRRKIYSKLTIKTP